MKVFLDTGTLLWLTEGDEARAESVRQQLALWLDRGVEFGTSTQTLLELLVHPKALGDLTRQYRYRSLLSELMSGPFLSMDDQAAELAAELVGKNELDLHTASQLSIASVHGFDVFYTTQEIPPDIADCTVLQCFSPEAAEKILSKMNRHAFNF